MEPDSLSLATFDELFTELERRFPSVLVVTNGPDKEDPTKDNFRVWYGGGIISALGCASLARVWLEKDVAENLEETDG